MAEPAHDPNALRRIEINRSNPDNITPTHVNDLLLSFDGKEFFFHFYEIEPPVILEDTDLTKLISVEAFVKVKLVVSPEFAENMSKVLAEQVEKYKAFKDHGRE